jgi:16S rRNA (guanine527-N7)-methyltransferase
VDVDVTARKLEIFARAVETSPHNLVSARATQEVRTRHIPECVRVAELLPSGPASLLDVGSGGGFPGLVIAAVRPDLAVTLLDATRKKAEFLRMTAEAMDVRVEVVNDRAEAAIATHGGRFDLVTARAVAPLARLVGWTVPFLAPGGHVYAVKGERWREELGAASEELRHHGGEVVATPEDVPDGARQDGVPEPRVVIIRRAA